MTPLSNFPPWLLVFSGAAFGWLKSFWHTVWDNTVGRLERLISVKLLIEEADYDEAYRWISIWAEYYLNKKKVTDLSLRKKYRKSDGEEEYEAVPGYGVYWFWWNKKLVEFHSKKEKGGAGSEDSPVSSIQARRSVSISIYGTRKRRVIFDVLVEAKQKFEEANPKSLKYYTHAREYWTSNILPKRELNTIYLPKEIKEDVLFDINKFLASEQAYRSVGIPWRKGYLFYGPPGGGKSVFIQALSNELNLPIYYLNLNSITNIITLVELLQDVGKGILLIEDVDCVSAAKKERSDDGGKISLKTSDLLNCIDGILATEGRILIMTTNYLEKLDAALIRAGRIDRKYHFDYARQEELIEFYNVVKIHFPVPPLEEFLSLLPSPCTIADAQGILFRREIEEPATTSIWQTESEPKKITPWRRIKRT